MHANELHGHAMHNNLFEQCDWPMVFASVAVSVEKRLEPAGPSARSR